MRPQSTPEARARRRPPVPKPHWPRCPPQVVLKSKDDQVTVIGAGVTLHEALAAADLLKKGEEGPSPSQIRRRRYAVLGVRGDSIGFNADSNKSHLLSTQGLNS